MAQDLKERILSSIVKDSNDCWIWQFAKEKAGYGKTSVSIDGKRVSKMAHRLSYEVFVGEIPVGLQLDHLCKITSCVNPEHLEAVTAKENLHRSSLKERWSQKRAITNCPRGHLYSAENTLIKKNRWGNDCRNCRKCHSEREMRRYYSKKLTLGTA